MVIVQSVVLFDIVCVRVSLSERAGARSSFRRHVKAVCGIQRRCGALITMTFDLDIVMSIYVSVSKRILK